MHVDPETIPGTPMERHRAMSMSLGDRVRRRLESISGQPSSFNLGTAQLINAIDTPRVTDV